MKQAFIRDISFSFQSSTRIIEVKIVKNEKSASTQYVKHDFYYHTISCHILSCFFVFLQPLSTPRSSRLRLFREVQVVVEPLSGNDLVNVKTWFAVGERSEVEEAPDDDGEDTAGSGPHAQQVLGGDSLADGLVGLRLLVLCDVGVAGLELVDVDGFDVEDEFDQCTGDEGRCEMGWQVVVEEELTTHDEEGDVMGGPGEEEETGAVVKTVASACKR